MTPDLSLPMGTVTFLFTDIEGSTRLVAELGAEPYREVIGRHHSIVRGAIARRGGRERGTQGDAFLVVFPDASAAIKAAVDAQRAMAEATWPAGLEVRVRMGLHTGQGIAGGDDYVGLDINRAARISAAGYGGQVLISDATRALVERTLPDGVELRDLGRHRLKDLAEPERLHQLVITGLPSDFPPLRTAESGRSNLPPRLSSFVGRDRELRELRELAATARLITLTGPGGTGKTSLAVELARELAGEYEDGAYVVALDPITDPDLVGSSIVSTLGLRDMTGRSARERLIDNLAGRRLVLVIDNFEHVLEAADLVHDLVAAAPGVTFVVTSRAPLRLAGEHVFPVEPLAVPEAVTSDLEAIGTAAAVRLFVDRARQALPSFRLTGKNVASVVDICRRLDGLPLGIEIAAARLGLLGVDGVRDRLSTSLDLPGAGMRDAPSRQRTLRTTVAWSYDLLDEPGRQLFTHMAVFVGGSRPGELEVVCAPAMPAGASVIEAAAGLLEQSLIRSAEDVAGLRFDMLETIRRDAIERFEALADRESTRRAHALAYLALAEANEEQFGTRGRARVVQRLGPERDNFRAALRWAADAGDAGIALRLAAALGWYWGYRGELEEGRAAVEAALAMPGADEPTPARLRALEAAGTIAYYSGRMEEATSRYSAELALARSLGDRLGTADALFNLSFTRPPSEFVATGALLDEADEIYRELGDERRSARVLWTRGAGLKLSGQDDAAIATWERSFEISRTHDDVQYEALAASSLATTALETGRLDEAARWFVAGLAWARLTSDLAGITLALPIIATATAEIVGPEPAAVLMGAYEALSRRFGVNAPPGLTMTVRQGDPMGRIAAAMEPEAMQDAMDRGRSMSVDEAAAFVSEIAARLGVVHGPAEVDQP